MVPKNNKHKCAVCCEVIHEHAIICYHCGFYQSQKKSLRILNWFKRYGTVATLFPIVFLIISIISIYLTTLEKIDAKDALDIATKVQKDVEKRAKEIKKFQIQLLNFEETIYFVYIRTDRDFMSWQKALSYEGITSTANYTRLYFLSIRDRSITRDVPERFFFDLFEVGFIEWLVETYRYNWIRKKGSRINIAGFGSTGMGGSWPKRAADDSTVWKLEDIQKEFSNNIFYGIIKKGTPSSFDAVPLPKGMEVNTTRKNEYKRLIEMVNDYLTLTISIHGWHPKPLTNDEKKSLNLDKILSPKLEWKSQIISVTFKAEFSTDKILSDYAAKQHKWAKQMISLFRSEYDWNLFKKDLRKQSNYDYWEELREKTK